MSRVVSVTIWASVDDGEVIRLGEAVFTRGPVNAAQIIREVLAYYDKHDPAPLAIDGHAYRRRTRRRKR